MVESNRAEAIVEFDYVAHETDELTLRKGDIITDIKIQPGGWWEGCLGGKRGMFPDNFVRVLSEPYNKKDSLLDNVPLRSTSGRKCKVLFSYQPANDDELALQVNDIIDIIGEVEEGWWKGKLRDMSGVFPSNFVTEVKDSSSEENYSSATSMSHKSRSSSREDASESDGEVSTSVSSPDSSQLLDTVGKSDQEGDVPLLPPKPVKELCRALFPYDAANDDELSLKEGDIITLLSKEVADKGWWRGELRGRVGVFPDNFVEMVLQDEQPKKPERPPAKSQVATTNRIRDTITKPATPVAATKSETEVTLRKTPEMPWRTAFLDDKMGPSAPPVPGKKPQLPPPIKKPQRLGMIGAPKHYGSTEGLTDAVDGAGPSRASRTSFNVARNSKDEVPEFDSVERNAMLIHPTASRAKAPRRRPPTSVYNKETEVSAGLMNGSADTGHNDLENHHAHEEPGEKEDIGPRGRVWEKNKVPWVEELKLNQARKSIPGNRTSLSPRSPTFLQGGSVSSSRSPEPLEKKQTTPAPKDKAPAPLLEPAKIDSTQGQSRVTSPQNISTKAPTSSEPAIPIAQAPAGVTLRYPRVQSVYTSDVVRGPQPRPFSMGSSALSVDPTRLGTEPNQTSPGLKSTPNSHSINRSTSPLPSSLTPAVPAVKTEACSPSSISNNAALTSPASTFPSPGSTVPQKQYLELKGKVALLEQSLEQQKQAFSQALKELAEKLNEEIARRRQIEQDLDKLTNLVTQV